MAVYAAKEGFVRQFMGPRAAGRCDAPVCPALGAVVMLLFVRFRRLG